MSKRFRPRVGARGRALRCEPLEDRTVPALLVGLTEDNRLVSFDSAAPGTTSAPVPITNLQPAETVLGVDYRPANNKLYALGSTSRLYTIDAATGKATQVGTGPFVVPLSGTEFGFDFNPAVDKLRVVSNTGQNLRLNADTGVVLDGDPATAGVQPDKALNTGPTSVVGAAYSNNFDRPLVTTLYGIDATADRLVAIGGLDGGPPAGSPNAGVTTAFGKLGFDADGRVGFDIGINGKAFATLTAPGGTTSQLFAVDVSVINPNGVAATPVGMIGFALRGVTAAPFLVTNTGDSGPGSLRQAILDANASAGTDVIAFAIGTGPQTIAPLSALPDVTEAVVLDATTQLGFAGSPLIELNGQQAGAAGLSLLGHVGSTVRGLVINRFDADGITITGGGGHTIVGNFIGTDAKGLLALGNLGDGVRIVDSSANTIGGMTAATRNVLSGNGGSGVSISGAGSAMNAVLGNRIGTDPAGAVALPNVTGVAIGDGASNNMIGGTTAGAGNLISGNVLGVSILGPATGGNAVLGNIIGTDAAGAVALPNTSTGVLIGDGANGNLIGTTASGAGNLISGNTDDGALLTGGATNNSIQGNRIGTDTGGTKAIPNTNGVTVSDGFGNRITGNVIAFNTLLGIDLGGDGPTANDPGDADDGANRLQNFPDLSAAQTTTTAVIRGTLSGMPNAMFVVELFTAGGQTALGTVTVTTDATGTATFKFTTTALPDGATVTATATNADTGDTSEFAPEDAVVADTIAPMVTVASTAPDPAGVSPIRITVVFSEPVFGFGADDLVAANATIGNFTALSATTFTFTLTPTAAGPVTVMLAAGAAEDAAANPTPAASLTRTFDNVAPTLTINQAADQPDPAGPGGVRFTVVFGEAVTGFDASDVVVGGTAGATTATVTGSGTSYTVTVAGVNQSGTVIVSVAAGAAVDAAGNLSAAPVVLDGTVTVNVPTSPPPPPPPPPPGQSPGLRLLAASGSGGTVNILTFDAAGMVQPLVTGFIPFPGRAGTVRSATGDFDGDGTADAAYVTGPGGGALLRVVSGKTGADLLPATDTFAGEDLTNIGLFVAAGDLDGDGIDEVVITPDQGGGARVKLFRASGGNLALAADFLGIDDPNFRGGGRPALGDLTGDGKADLSVAAGFGGGPRIALFDGAQLAAGLVRKLVGDFFVFEPALRNGAFVAGGDVTGDGKADLAVGAGPGGAPRILVLDALSLLQNATAAVANPVANFFAFDPGQRGGVRVAVKDVDRDARLDLVAGNGDGGAPLVSAYAGKALAGTPTPIQTFAAFADPFLPNGVFVG